MATILLTQNYVATIDDEDYEELSQYKWMFNSGYASRQKHIGMIDGKQKQVRIHMHRQITGFSKLFVDHINGDKLDNRKSNLRLVTHSQNMMNRSVSSNSKSGLKGVYQHKGSKKWFAFIGLRKNDKGYMKHIGSYETKELAAEAYNKAALENFKEFARTN